MVPRQIHLLLTPRQLLRLELNALLLLINTLSERSVVNSLRISSITSSSLLSEYRVSNIAYDAYQKVGEKDLY